MVGLRTSTGTGAPSRQFTVREGHSRADMFFLKRLWDHYFGLDLAPDHLPAPLADVLGWVPEDEAPLAVSTPIAEHDGVRIGGGVACLETQDHVVEELPDSDYDAETLAADRSVWLYLGVVDPAWRGHGIGRAIFRHRLDWAREQDAEMVFSTGWERDEGRSSRPLFEAFGFVPVQHFPDYYRQTDRLSCPDCGVWPSDDDPCECGATLWALDGGDL